jgi:hypothetical protein
LSHQAELFRKITVLVSKLKQEAVIFKSTNHNASLKEINEDLAMELKRDDELGARLMMKKAMVHEEYKEEEAKAMVEQCPDTEKQR